MKKVKIGISAVLALIGVYILGDAWDVVPGLFTTKPPLSVPEPYPQVSEPHVTNPKIPSFATLPELDSAQVRTIMEEFRTDERLSGVSSYAVIDPLSGKTVASHNEAKSLRPASTMKYVTAVAALTTLGPNATLDTSVTRVGRDVYLVGGGDVMLAAGDGQPSAVAGRSGLADMARQVAQKLQKAKVSEITVHVDSSRYAQPVYHPSVVAEENTEFVMPLYPVAVDRGRVDSEFVEQPDVRALDAFAERLREQGVSVTVGGRKVAPKDSQELVRVHSAPVRELVDVMMVESDNTLAEVLGHEVAIASGESADFSGASAAVKGALRSADFDVTGLVIDDNSGLSEHNRVPVRLLGDILRRVWACDGCDVNALGAALPVGSLQGTLKDRFWDSPAQGLVRAKTGTLSTTTALAGFVSTRSGHPLIFVSIVTDHKENDQLTVRAVIDDAVAKLVSQV